MLAETTATVRLFGEEREVRFERTEYRLTSVEYVVLGRFPTGTKLHRSWLTLWKREQPGGRSLRGETAATVDGEEYVADTTLYIHNSNRGRICAWNDEAFAAYVGRWN